MALTTDDTKLSTHRDKLRITIASSVHGTKPDERVTDDLGS